MTMQSGDISESPQVPQPQLPLVALNLRELRRVCLGRRRGILALGPGPCFHQNIPGPWPNYLISQYILVC